MKLGFFGKAKRRPTGDSNHTSPPDEKTTTRYRRGGLRTWRAEKSPKDTEPSRWQRKGQRADVELLEQALEQICSHLSNVGIKADVLERGRTGEKRGLGSEVVGRITVEDQQFDEILVISHETFEGVTWPA